MEKSERILSIDQFRGLAIILMVAANFLAGVTAIPAWFKHAPDIGLTVIDLIAPFFIFAIGLTYRPSFERRLQRDGAGKTYTHFAVRFLAIAGIGAVFAAGESMLGDAKVFWGVLQAIGAAGLVTLAVIRLNKAWRAVIAIAILIGYQLVLDSSLLDSVLHSAHGGLFGSLSWSAMMILSTVMADLFHEKERHGGSWLPWILLAMIVGVAATFFVPLSKNRVSLSYVLVCNAVSAFLFGIFDVFTRHTKKGAPFLTWWGMNPLFLYLLHLILTGIFFLPGIPWWYSEATLWLAFSELAFLYGVLTLIAWALFRKNIVIKI
jgi:predicted acyltransferase